MKFVNRKTELRYLQEQYREKRAKFVPIYGRRRVGKTRLIREFITNKPHIYFLCEQTAEYDQLRQISIQIGEFFNEPLLIKQNFSSWIDVFEFLGRRSEKYILVFDEFPYLCQVNKGASSIFQKGWDLYLNKTNVFLILSGSSIVMMEKEVLFYKAPLYGRRTGQILLKPFNFAQSNKFLQGKKIEEMVDIYALLGGIPAYLLEYEQNLSLWQNIKKKILKPESFLAREPEFILREELREPRTYFTILKAIGEGKRKFGEIANAVGLAKTSLSKYLGILESLQFIEREVPITEKLPEKSKKGLYRLQDNFFNFYFSLVFPFRADLEKGLFDLVLDKRIKPRFMFLSSFIFEDICSEYIHQVSGKLLPRFDKNGRFWDKNIEIDIVALNEEEENILLGECKWSNRLVGVNIYKDLLQKEQNINWSFSKWKKYYALFSKKGFTTELKELARNMPNLFLFSLKDMKGFYRSHSLSKLR